MAKLKSLKVSKTRPITPTEHIMFMWDRACGLAIVHGYSYSRVKILYAGGKIAGYEKITTVLF